MENVHLVGIWSYTVGQFQFRLDDGQLFIKAITLILEGNMIVCIKFYCYLLRHFWKNQNCDPDGSAEGNLSIGIINVYTEHRGNPSNSCWIFQSGPKCWNDLMTNRWLIFPLEIPKRTRGTILSWTSVARLVSIDPSHPCCITNKGRVRWTRTYQHSIS